jgi:hypothetical protein
MNSSGVYLNEASPNTLARGISAGVSLLSVLGLSTMTLRGENGNRVERPENPSCWGRPHLRQLVHKVED